MTDFSKIAIADLAALIATTLEQHGLDTVLVGGACVTIYSHNRYQSYDLDLVSYAPIRKIKRALLQLGFQEEGKYFCHPDCPFFLDFVSPPVAVGQEPIRQFEILKTSHGTLRLLTPTDCVKDRLASFYHWDDKQGLEQALLVTNEQTIDLDEIKRWSLAEGHKAKHQIYRKSLPAKREGPSSDASR